MEAHHAGPVCTVISRQILHCQPTDVHVGEGSVPPSGGHGTILKSINLIPPASILFLDRFASVPRSSHYRANPSRFSCVLSQIHLASPATGLLSNCSCPVSRGSSISPAGLPCRRSISAQRSLMPPCRWPGVSGPTYRADRPPVLPQDVTKSTADNGRPKHIRSADREAFPRSTLLFSAKFPACTPGFPADFCPVRSSRMQVPCSSS